MWLVSDEPGLPGGAGEQRELLARLRAVVEAKDTEVTVLRAELSAALDREAPSWSCGLPNWNAGLGMDSSNSGTPSSKEPIGAKERPRPSGRTGTRPSGSGARTASAAGSPGTPGAACPGTVLRTSRRPSIRRPSARVRGEPGRGAGRGAVVGAGLGRADHPVGDRAPAAVAGVPVLRESDDRRGARGRAPGTISYGPGINAAAVLLSGYGNVPSERAARLIAMLLGIPVSGRLRGPGQRSAG